MQQRRDLAQRRTWLDPVERLREHHQVEPPPGRIPGLERRHLDVDALVGGKPRHLRIRFHGKDFCAGIQQLAGRDARACPHVENP
jgi:hypothetical protein